MKINIKISIISAMLALSTGISASAALFPDANSHWAESYISDMNSRGIIQGYTDGTFRPENSVTTVELLVMLARMCNLKQDVKTLIYNDYKDYLSSSFGTNLSWAHESFAICIEGGIITESELSALYNNGSLSKSAAKELLSVFLVRAMGLEQTAKNSQNTSLSFADTESISSLRRPYVYVLSSIGIVQGNTKNQFEPKSDVTRAVTATMISRALSYMEENGVSIKFDKYQNEKWISGIVSDIAIENNRLKFNVKDELSASESVSVSTSCAFYYDGISTDISSISDGKYVMILFKGDNAEELRICSSYQKISGIVLTSSAKEISIYLDELGAGSVKTFEAAGFTKAVIDSGTTGGSEVLSSAARFAQATCIISGQNQLLCASFEKSAQIEQGTIENLSTSGNEITFTFSHLNGMREQMRISSEVYTLVDGKASDFSKSHEGKLVSCVLSSDKSRVLIIEVDTDTALYQGTLKNVMTDATPKLIYLTDANGNITGYKLSPDDSLIIQSKGSDTTLYKLDKGLYTSVKSVSNSVSEIYSYAASCSVSGEISSITYGDNIIIKIISADNREMSFYLNPAKLPTITRGGKASSIDKLRARDAVTITQTSGTITSIEASSKTADATGIITGIQMELSGNILSYKTADGSVYSYPISDGAEITKNGKPINISDLKIGYTVGLVTGDGTIFSIDVTQTTSVSSGITAKVLYINTGDNTLLVETTDASGQATQMTIKVSSSANLVNSSDGGTFFFRNIKISDTLTIYGAYDGTQFKATIIIK